jgi:AcrR family transcriptional regulator
MSPLRHDRPMSRPQPPARRPRRRLDRDTIVAEALRLVRAEGIEAVTMRRLADELGSGPMSFYRHVADRQALLIAMLDAVAQGIRLPPAVGDPRSEITAVFTAIHDALRQDHWATQLIVGEKLAGPSILPAIERIYAALRAAGLTPRDTAVAYALLWQYTAGELLDRHHVTADSYSQRMVREADPDTYPRLMESINAFPPGPAGDWFTESFQRILDGLLLTSLRSAT